MRLTAYTLALAFTVAGCSQDRPLARSAESDKAQTPAAAAQAPVRAEQASLASSASEKSAVPAASRAPNGATDPSDGEVLREAQVREIEVPAGTAMSIKLGTPIASDASQVEDEVRGKLTSDILVDGAVAVPAGSGVIGTVRDAQRSGRVKGRALIAFQFERLVVRGAPLAIRSSTVTREAAANRGEDLKKAAIGGAAGAIVGGLFKGGKGAVIGAGVGGTGAVLATRGEEVRLAAGTIVRATLRQPLKVTVRGAR